MDNLFESIADAYDSWYDTPEGNAIFREEAQCLHKLCDDFSGRWLEVGVGTGRFSLALGVTHGIDLSLGMVERAVSRGIQGQVGRAEQLPFQRETFDGVLMALSLCFLENPEAAFMECARVLRDKGKLVLGTIPADSPWGRTYINKGAQGHPVYSHARFHTIEEVIRLAENADFRLRQSYSALCWEPDRRPAGLPKIAPGVVAEAGFVGLLFETGRFFV